VNNNFFLERLDKIRFNTKVVFSNNILNLQNHTYNGIFYGSSGGARYALNNNLLYYDTSSIDLFDGGIHSIQDAQNFGIECSGTAIGLNN
jgi:hypothetical protein